MEIQTTIKQPPGSHPRRWTILALILAAECMDLLDGTIVNVAAPTIHRDLHTGSTALQWIIGGYALTFAIGLITGGRLGDIFGRKRMFVIGAIGFVAASLACGLASDSTMLIVCRLLQGGTAALLIPQGLGILYTIFDPSEMPKAFGVFGPVIGMSAVLGPIVGGALIAANVFGTTWRLVFFVNLPLGLIAALGAVRLIPESHAQRRPQLDLVGTALAATAMGLLIYPLIQGRDAGWPTWTYAMIAASAATFGLFVAWSRRQQRRGRDALVQAGIFRHRAYTAGLATILVFFTGMIGTLLVLTLFLQLGEHFSAIHAGLTLAPFAAGMAVGAGLGSAVIVPRFGRLALQCGCIPLAGGIWWLHQLIASHQLHTGSVTLIAPLLIAGIGIGMIVAPLFDFILASVTTDEVGSASGVLNTIQQLAGAVGVAALGTLFFSTLSRRGFVTAADHCLVAELLSTPVLAVLLRLLPARARNPQAVETIDATRNHPAPVGANS